MPLQSSRYAHRKIDSILQTARTNLARAQLRYKANFDRAVRSTPTLKTREMIYLYRAPANAPLDEMELASRNLL